MSGQDSPGVGVAGTSYCKHSPGCDYYSLIVRLAHYNYPGIYDTNDFHHCEITTLSG